MRKFFAPLVVAVIAFVSAMSAAASAQDPWEADIRRFEEADAANPPAKGGVVFIGSSSIALWKTLQEDFAGLNVINRGFGGSQLSDSVRYADRIVMPYEPKLVVLFAGTNDINSGKSAETVFADYQAFVQKIRAKLPNTRIAYISISPAPSRWNKIDEFKRANRLIQQYTLIERDLAFIDVFPYMLDERGGPRPEIFVEDQLHLNSSGYAIWKKVVAPYLPWGR